MNTKWMSFVHSLYSPTALGIYITITMVWLSLTYYTSKDLGVAGSTFVQTLRNVHEVSIDFRLQARGPVKPKAPVVILTIDEKAVETIGRWPFSRRVMAQAVDRTFALGAKVMAFDIIFSESERNELKTAVNDLKLQGLLNPELASKLELKADADDGDRLLGEAFERHRSKIVGGSFFDYHDDQYTPSGAVDYCTDLTFRQTPEFKIWDAEEALISIQDPYQATPPFEMNPIFERKIQQETQSITKKYGSNPSPIAQAQMKVDVQNHLRVVCDTFFDDIAKDFAPIWKTNIYAKLNSKDFTFANYSDWLFNFQNKLRPNGLSRVDGWNMNTPALAAHLSHNGYFNAHQDSDGTIRSSTLAVRTGNLMFPSMSLKAYLIGTNRNASLKMDFNQATGRKEVTDFEITDNDTGDVVEKIPTDGLARLQINYAGPQKMYPHLSFADLLSDAPEMEVSERVLDKASKKWVEKIIKVPRANYLKDKYVIVGPTAIGIFDLRVTPFEKKTYPGVETHANVLGNLIERNFLKAWEDERSQMPLFLLGLGIAHTLLLTQLGALGGMVVTLGLLGGLIGLDKLYLFDRGIVVAIVWPLFSILLNYLILTTYRYLTEERGKKELRATFQKYVSPAIVEEILSDPKNIELGGKKMHLTVFFSDVRGFTTISEKLDPHALSNLLNSYLTPMTEIVFKNQGTLDKYMGDAIMAFFGAPIHYEKHAHFACRAALHSLEKLFELQKQFKAQGLPLIDLGIGLNSGEVSAGNMGSQTVRSYTVMGDAVNLASRLEGINKEYGTRIIISEFTYALVKDSFTCREVDWVRVKGKMKPVVIHELIAEGKVDAERTKFLASYQEAYDAYRKKDWDKALQGFTSCLNQDPEDALSTLFLERTQAYMRNPPPWNWDGVFEMKTK